MSERQTGEAISSEAMWYGPALRLMRADLAAAHERIAQLTQALAPFAAAADDVDGDALDRSNIWEMPCSMSITVGDLRTALRMVGDVGRAPT